MADLYLFRLIKESTPLLMKITIGRTRAPAYLVFTSKESKIGSSFTAAYRPPMIHAHPIDRANGIERRMNVNDLGEPRQVSLDA
jgi:hypothetical protein